MQTLSDVHDQSFGKNYGVLIEGLPLPLLSRAVFVVDGAEDHLRRVRAGGGVTPELRRRRRG